MTVLVGVHGIRQQQRGRHQLQGPWSLAVADGLERASGTAVAVPDLDIAFYGDLVWPRGGDGHKARQPDLNVLNDFDEDELDDLESSARELVTTEELAAARDAPASKAYTRTPGPLRWLMAALERKFGAAAVVLFVGELRQVRRYLRDHQIKQDVDARVRKAVADDCRVLIGHSLGSVVAFEYVRQNPDHRLDLLLTLGSPLGLRMVRDRMAGPSHGSGMSVPANPTRWMNVRDVHDPVACAGDLATWWPGVVDQHVNNQGDAHNAERYLSKRPTGQAILEAVPELAL
ncbi:MAG TPA: hypothetical protein VHJ83_07825 [Micromonosporaceae bacterium]|nr:hypothetical protein [Micromonosporaceae bacterium]